VIKGRCLRGREPNEEKERSEGGKERLTSIITAISISRRVSYLRGKHSPGHREGRGKRGSKRGGRDEKVFIQSLISLRGGRNYRACEVAQKEQEEGKGGGR